MTETTKNTGEKLSVASTKTLTLKRGGVEQGVVRQSFSHGRSKAVVVEKVKRRVAPPTAPAEKTDGGAAAVAKRLTQTTKTLAREETPPKTTDTSAKPGVVLRPLTQAEIDARASALDKAEQVEVQEREAAKQRAEALRVQREAEQKERAEAAARKAQEEQRHAREESTKKRADELAQKRLGAEVTIGKQGARINEAEEESEAPRTRRPARRSRHGSRASARRSSLLPLDLA